MINSKLFDFLKFYENRDNDFKHLKMERYPEVYHSLKETAYLFANAIAQFDTDIDADFLDPFLTIKSCLEPKNRSELGESRPYFLIVVGKETIWKESAGYYLQIYADICCVGGGIYLPSKNGLRKIRSQIIKSADQWLQIVSRSNAAQISTKRLCTSRRLKKMPLGYSQRGKVASYIKMRDFFTNEEFPKEVFLNALGTNKVSKLLQETKSLVDFLNRGLEQTVPVRAKVDLLSIIGF